MINTPELWVGIAFLICIVLFVKLILPKLQGQIASYRQKVESGFLEAENILFAAEKKFAAAKELVDALPDIVLDVEKDFEIKINDQLKEWADRKEKIAMKYEQTKEYHLRSINNHIKNKICFNVVAATSNVLKIYFEHNIKAKDHQKIVLDSLKHFPKF